VFGGVVGHPVVPDAQITRIQARVRMRTAWGWRPVRVSAWASMLAAQGKAWREASAKSIRALRSFLSHAQRNPGVRYCPS
jgi:hypothetical protein